MEIESTPLDGILSAEIPYVSDLDKPLLRRYMTMLNEWHKLRDIREREGLFTNGAQGQLVAHPVVKMLNVVEAKLLSMEDRLGLNPAARLRLSADQAKQTREELSLGAMLDEAEEQ